MAKMVQKYGQTPAVVQSVQVRGTRSLLNGMLLLYTRQDVNNRSLFCLDDAVTTNIGWQTDNINEDCFIVTTADQDFNRTIHFVYNFTDYWPGGKETVLIVYGQIRDDRIVRIEMTGDNDQTISDTISNGSFVAINPDAQMPCRIRAYAADGQMLEEHFVPTDCGYQLKVAACPVNGATPVVPTAIPGIASELRDSCDQKP